jgi:hypothetical protein
MHCSKCATENPAGKKFCGGCGSALSAKCPQCGAENTPSFKFCGDCGTAIVSDSAVPVAAAVNLSGTDAGGERRHLTVLFCDLVGSTEIASHLDPEQWREIVREYHRAAAQAIERFGGRVAHYLGDGVIAYFGYPEAHDNDAERAARAGPRPDRAPGQSHGRLPVVGFDQFQECAVRILEAEELGSGFIAEADYHRSETRSTPAAFSL